MIKNKNFDFSYDYLRFDASWKFEWNASDITSSTAKFYPFTEQGTNRIWQFNADNSVSITTHDEQTWDAEQPWLEYDAGDVASWDSSHVNNMTRYLSTGSSFITLTNTLQTVIIDNAPPEFVTDTGTEYVWICEKINNDRENIRRHCEFVFRDQSGLDFSNFEIKIGDVILYKYSRIDGAVLSEEYIDASSFKICSDGFNTYKVAFDFMYGIDDEELDYLNNNGLTVVVYDKAANSSFYTFGPNSSHGNQWRIIELSKKLTEIEPLVIKFYDIDPENRIISQNNHGSVWVSVFNPNEDLWCLDPVIGLSDTATAECTINPSTYDDTEYAATGVIKFKIENISSYGIIEVEAWLKSGIETIDDTLKASSYAIEKCGPWISMDPDGRKYDLMIYVPKYLKNTEFAHFMKFFETYLNTVYTDLSKKSNISILEKIAHIDNFSDIDRVESEMLKHYANSRAFEFDVNLQSIEDLNIDFFNENSTLTSKTDEDVLSVVRYVFKNLPYYNQLKGTVKGIEFALKMFSLSCKLVNLWCKSDIEVEEYPNFISEDELLSFSSYFMTSRMNLEYSSMNIDFASFNDSIDTLVKLIVSVKPITKILNKIKYIVEIEKEFHTLANQFIHYDHANIFTYEITWGSAQMDKMTRKSTLDASVYHADKIWIEYVPESIKVSSNEEAASDPADLSNAYTLLSSFLFNTDHKLIFNLNYEFNYDFTASTSDDDYMTTVAEQSQYDKKFTYAATKSISIDDIDVKLYDTGFYIIPKTGDVATHLYDFVIQPLELSDTCVKVAKDVRNFIIEDLKNHHEEMTEEEYENKLDYIQNRLPIEITPILNNREAKMTMKLKHATGTEICFCLDPS